MATTTTASGKISFANMIGNTKRRRMRSGGNVSTLTNNTPRGSSRQGNMPPEEQPQQGKTEGKCKGATTIPIFLKKTYKMIDTCDPNIASWTPDGDMFVVKDPDLFASTIIPQYFDHNKFSSFARQLNFYGFRKMQSKPIRNVDFNVDTAKHVTFYNEKFKRGRCDLLKDIQRSTRGGGAHSNVSPDVQREIDSLKTQVTQLENKVEEMNHQMEERMNSFQLDMLGRMEQILLAMQQHQQTQLQLQQQQSVGVSSANNEAAAAAAAAAVSMDSLRGSFSDSLRGSFNLPPHLKSIGSLSTQQQQQGGVGGPTLPPHPKQKQLPTSNLPSAMAVPPARFNSLRGISRLDSVGSSASAILLRNSLEDKFFSTLMLGEQGGGGGDLTPAAAASPAAGGGGGVMPMNAGGGVGMVDPMSGVGIMSAPGTMMAPRPITNDRHVLGQQRQQEQQHRPSDSDEGSLSSVSDGGM